MNLTEAIYARRAVRSFDGRSVAASVLSKLLDAAVQAPSAMNGQPWIFAIVEDREQLKRYSDRAKAELLELSASEPKVQSYAAMLRDPNYNIFYNAPALVVIGVKERNQFSDADCWLAAQNLMLAACGAGLGTCCLGFALAVLNLPDVKLELKIPERGAAIAPILLGYPQAASAPVPRKSPEIVSFSRQLR